MIPRRQWQAARVLLVCDKNVLYQLHHDEMHDILRHTCRRCCTLADGTRPAQTTAPRADVDRGEC